MVTVTDFIFLGSKVTADGDCSLERHLLLGRKAMTKLDSTLKSRDITLLTKVHIVTAMVFPVAVHGCERRLSAKELMPSNCGAGENSWEFLRQQGDQMIKPVNPKRNKPWTFIEGLRLKLKLQYFGDAMPRADSLQMSDAGKDWGQEEKWVTEDEMVGWYHWLNGHEFEQTPGDTERQGSLACCIPWGHKVRPNWATEEQQQRNLHPFKELK